MDGIPGLGAASPPPASARPRGFTLPDSLPTSTARAAAGAGAGDFVDTEPAGALMPPGEGRHERDAVVFLHAQTGAVQQASFAAVEAQARRAGRDTGAADPAARARAGASLADFGLIWPEYLADDADCADVDAAETKEEDGANAASSRGGKKHMATIFASALTSSGVEQRRVHGTLQRLQRDGSLGENYVSLAGTRLSAYADAEEFLGMTGTTHVSDLTAVASALSVAKSMRSIASDGDGGGDGDDAAAAAAPEAATGSTASGGADASNGGAGGTTGTDGAAAAAAAADGADDTGGEAGTQEEGEEEGEASHVETLELDSVRSLRCDASDPNAIEIVTPTVTWVLAPKVGEDGDAGRETMKKWVKAIVRHIGDVANVMDAACAERYGVELASSGGIKRAFSAGDTCGDLIGDVVSHLERRGETVRRGRYVLKATGYRDYALLRNRKLLHLEYVRECMRESREIRFSIVRFTDTLHAGAGADVGVYVDGANPDSEAASTAMLSRASSAGTMDAAAAAAALTAADAADAAEAPSDDPAAALPAAASPAALKRPVSARAASGGGPNPLAAVLEGAEADGGSEPDLHRTANAETIDSRGRALSATLASAYEELSRVSSAEAEAFRQTEVSDEAVCLSDVNWPFRIRVWAAENVEASTTRVDIVHGEEVFRKEAQRVESLKVRCAICFNGGVLPGGEAETRSATYDPAASWWTPAEWVSTELMLRDIPQDARVLLELRSIHSEAVESTLLASVCLPLLDFRRRLLTGKRALRLWPNHLETMKGPPGVNTVDEHAPVLQVEFDSYPHPVVAPDVLGISLAAEEDGDATIGEDPPVEKVGWMYKLGKSKLTVWRRRWFVLRESTGTLAYYHSNLDTKPRGIISLDDVEVTTCDSLNKRYQHIVGSTRKTLTTHTFQIRKREKGARTYYIHTFSLQERNEWMDAIAMASLMVPTLTAKPRTASRGVFGRMRGKSISEPAAAAASGAARGSSSSLDVAEGRAAMVLDQGDASVAGEAAVDLSNWVESMEDVVLHEPLLPTFMGVKGFFSAPAADASAPAADGDDGQAGGDGAAGDSEAAGDAAAGDAAAGDSGDVAAEEEPAAADAERKARRSRALGKFKSAAHAVALAASGQVSLGIEAALNDPALLYAFALSQVRSVREENVLFWLEAEWFRRKCADDDQSEPGCHHYFAPKWTDGQRLAEARHIYDTYISSGKEYASEAPRERAGGSSLDSTGYEIGVSGRTKSTMADALRDGAPAVPAAIFAEAQRQTSLPVGRAFRNFCDSTVAAVVGESIDLKALRTIGLPSDATTVERPLIPAEELVAQLATWDRTRALITMPAAKSALESMVEEHGADAEYVSHCLCELSFNLAVASSFVADQLQGLQRLPNGGVHRDRAMGKAQRAEIFKAIATATSGMKTSPGGMSPDKLAEVLEERWFSHLDTLPFPKGGLLPHADLRGLGLTALGEPQHDSGSEDDEVPSMGASSVASGGAGSARDRERSVSGASARSTRSAASTATSASARRKRRVASLAASEKSFRRSSLQAKLANRHKSERDGVALKSFQQRVGGGSPDRRARSGEDERGSRSVVGAKLMGDRGLSLLALLQQDPCYELTAVERALLWRQRKDCAARYPRALPKFLKSISWVSPERVREARRLMRMWVPFEQPVEALELLDDRFGDGAVRAHAVSTLRRLSDRDLLFVLPQLVQALKYEVHHASPLALFLLERAIGAPNLLGQPLFWAMKVETTVSNPLSRLRFIALIDAYLGRCTPRARENLLEQERLWARGGVFSQVCESVKAFKKTGAGKAGVKAFARSELAKVNETLPSRFTLPLDARVEVKGIIVEECKVMDSAKLPLWLSFENADPAADNVLVMFKSGDDLRQDAVVLQLIRVMDDLWTKAGLTLRLSPYRCVSTWNDGGVLEIVTNSSTTAEIHTEYGGKLLGAYKDSTFASFIREHNPSDAEYAAAVENFVHSCAGYCIATYVMGIGDRHNDNIMVKRSGHYFHIDFGHFLGNFKYQFGVARERSAFVFTPEMAHVMGGKDDPRFAQFVEFACQALQVLRRHGSTLVNLFALMVPAGMPELSSREDINYLRNMLELQEQDEGVVRERFLRDLDAALNNKFKRFDNTVHILKHAL